MADDPDARLLRVTTVVRLKGIRGRLYFLPIRLLHDPITRSMMGAAVRRVSADVAVVAGVKDVAQSRGPGSPALLRPLSGASASGPHH